MATGWTVIVEYRGRRWEAFDQAATVEPKHWTDQDLESVPAPIEAGLNGLVKALEADPYFRAAGS